MLRRFFPVLFLSLFFSAHTAAAVDTVHVLVLPFEIHASQNLAYLEEDIPKVISEHLQTEGAVSVDMKTAAATPSPETASDIESLRQTGLNAGADTIIWGSMTRIGNSISLDISMAETVGNQPVFSVYEAGTGMENLRAISKKAAEKLARQSVSPGTRNPGARHGKQAHRSGCHRTGDPDESRRCAARRRHLQRHEKYLQNGLFRGYPGRIRNDRRRKRHRLSRAEKPTIRKSRSAGIMCSKSEKLRENLSISTGSILNIFTIKSNIEQLEAMYKEKNYHNVKIDYTAHDTRQQSGGHRVYHRRRRERSKSKKSPFRATRPFRQRR
jgi:outer membrane protein insertion porin family